MVSVAKPWLISVRDLRGKPTIRGEACHDGVEEKALRKPLIPGDTKNVRQSFLSRVTSRISRVMFTSLPATGGTLRKSKILSTTNKRFKWFICNALSETTPVVSLNTDNAQFTGCFMRTVTPDIQYPAAFNKEEANKKSAQKIHRIKPFLKWLGNDFSFKVLLLNNWANSLLTGFMTPPWLFFIRLLLAFKHLATHRRI